MFFGLRKLILQFTTSISLVSVLSRVDPFASLLFTFWTKTTYLPVTSFSQIGDVIEQLKVNFVEKCRVNSDCSKIQRLKYCSLLQSVLLLTGSR